MRAQIRGLDQASRNAQDGISMIQTAEGALNETHSILQRMRELADQAANDTNVNVDRDEIQKEINQLTSEINRIGNTTEFNTQKLLDGGASANKVSLGSNEAVGIGAKAATAMNTNAKAVTDNGFKLDGLTDLALYVGGINDDGTVKGIKFDFSDAAGAANKALLDAYKAGDNSFAGVDFTGLGGTAEGMQLALQNLTDDSGLVKLGDLMDITVKENGEISFASKATGKDVEFTFAANSYSATAGEETLVANVDLSSHLAKLGFASMNYDSDAAKTSWADLVTAKLTTVFKGQDGTAAVVTGNKIDAATYGDGSDKINADTAFGKKFDVTINGKTYNVEIDAEAITTGGLSTSSEANLVKTLNDALKRAVDKDGNEVNISGDVKFAATTDNKITLTVQSAAIPKDGATPTLKLSGDYASTILGGITDGKNAIGGTFTAKFQIGANEGQSFQMDIKDMRSQALGIAGTISGGSTDVAGAKFTKTLNVTNGTNNTSVEYSLDVSTHESASAAIKVISNAIEKVSAQRSQLGAYQNRLEHTINNLGTASENLTSAESRIRDVDMAKEMMEFTKNNILSQAAQAMLAQANQQPQGVLQLLR